MFKELIIQKILSPCWGQIPVPCYKLKHLKISPMHVGNKPKFNIFISNVWKIGLAKTKVTCYFSKT